MPGWYLELEPKLIELINQLSETEEKLKALRTTIQTMMDDDGIDGIESEFIKISMIEESFVESIIKNKLKEKMPDVYAKYVKTTYRKASVMIKLVDVTKNNSKC